MKQQPSKKAEEITYSNQWIKKPWAARFKLPGEPECYEVTNIYNCPYGSIGDVLWVRETFYALGKWQKNGITETGKQKYRFVDYTDRMQKGYMYLTSSEKPAIVETKKDGLIHWYKRPSIFMPREACRIRLKITDIRVERLQEISEEDAIAEGVQPLCLPKISQTESGEKFYNEGDYPTDHYQQLWESINGAGSWAKNPWVWVLSFERIQP